MIISLSYSTPVILSLSNKGNLTPLGNVSYSELPHSWSLSDKKLEESSKNSNETDLADIITLL